MVNPYYTSSGNYEGVPDHDLLVLKIDGMSNMPLVRLNSNATHPFSDAQLTTAGWGYTEPGGTDLSNELQVDQAYYATNEECIRIAQEQESLLENLTLDDGIRLTDDMMCVVNPSGGRVCQGDSGKCFYGMILDATQQHAPSFMSYCTTFLILFTIIAQVGPLLSKAHLPLTTYKWV